VTRTTRSGNGEESHRSRGRGIQATIISCHLGIPGKPVGVVIHSADPVPRGRRFARGCPVGSDPAGNEIMSEVVTRIRVEGDALQAGGTALPSLFTFSPEEGKSGSTSRS